MSNTCNCTEDLSYRDCPIHGEQAMTGEWNVATPHEPEDEYPHHSPLHGRSKDGVNWIPEAGARKNCSICGSLTHNASYHNEPPEDLQAALLELVSDIRLDPADRYDEQFVDDILRLCEAAALAALPEKRETHLKKCYTDQFKCLCGTTGHNEAIATAQANIHSVFGGTGK